MRNITFILLATVLFFACHKKSINKSQSTNNEAETSATKIDSTIKNAIIDAQVDMASTGAFYKVDSIKINGDILSIFVNYSGGCKEHVFDLYSNGMFGKSLPPQLSLCLKHNNNGDNCRGLLFKELKFNVSPLKYPNKNSIVLKLADKRVTYQVK